MTNTAFIVLFGVILPVISIVVELTTGMCAEAVFNPMPTLGHVLLVCFVPAANLASLIALYHEAARWRGRLLWCNGAVLGIALVYTLLYVPLMPVGLIAIVIFGIGFLPLTPILALCATIGLRLRLLRMAPPAPERPRTAAGSSLASLLVGAALAIVLLVGFEVRTALTRFAAEMVVMGPPHRSAQGVDLLRRFGSRDELLRMCYSDSDRGRGLLFLAPNRPMLFGPLFERVAEADAQNVFYRVTGLPYNLFPPPRGRVESWRDDFEFDPNIGGQAVAGLRRGLSLSSSRMDVEIQASAALAYTEWTMVFRNDRMVQQEARAQVQLPPGGVVSRVSLWVNGEAQEAAFGGVGQVRAAYKKVAVVQRRDPLLVTWLGPDRVMVQCFPVPPSGEMKIRLGISAPLALGAKTAALRLPCFAERNFGIATGEIHALWAGSDRPYRRVLDSLQLDSPSDGRYVLRGVLSEDDIQAPESAIVVACSGTSEQWAPDLKDPKAHVVQKVVSRRLPARRKLAIVIDGSAGMAERFNEVAEAIAAAGCDADCCVLLAGDAVEDLSGEVAGSGGGAEALAQRMQAVASPGGCDNVAALLKAMEHVAGGDRTIVWVHAAQPVVFRPVDSLAQWFERDRNMTLYDVAVEAGPNRVIGGLPESSNVQSLARVGSLRDDLAGLLARLTGKAEERSIERVRSEDKLPTTPKSSSQIARLWAAGQVLALVRSGKPDARMEAGRLATANQLVTPVSGAVVLETQQQYDESKLKPADPKSTPNVPEPSTLALLAAMVPVLGWLAWRRRRAARRLAGG